LYHDVVIHFSVTYTHSFHADCPNGFDYVLADNNQMSASSVYTKDTGDPAILKLHGPANGRLYNIMNAGIKY
jgi:hypothetical protein